MKHTSVLSVFLILPFMLNAQNPSKLVLDYDIDITSISDHHKVDLDSFMDAVTDSSKPLTLNVIGSADYLGSVEYNQKISDARVGGVVKYLKNNYAAYIDTIVTRSQGELDNEGYEDEGGGVRKHRTVTVAVVNQESDAIEALSIADSGDKIIFKNLNFQPGRHYLLKRSIPELHRLLELMIANPTLVIEIHGHICCEDFEKQREGMDVDTGKYELSINRAKNIYEYLVNKGIDPERLHYRGFGSSQKLVYPEITEEDKTQNRRVEIMVVER